MRRGIFVQCEICGTKFRDGSEDRLVYGCCECKKGWKERQEYTAKLSRYQGVEETSVLRTRELVRAMWDQDKGNKRLIEELGKCDSILRNSL